MKKALSVLLGLFLIFSLISCNEEVVEESEIIESADESVILDEFVLSDNVAKINSYLTNEVDRSLLATNVFKGLTYTLSRDTVEEHSDIGLKLTNGETVDMFDTYSFLGWKDRMPVSIDFDLGDSKHSIADITVECLRVMDYGIGLPEYISVQVSDDGEEYTDIGRIYTPKDIPDSTKFEYSFAFPKGSSARYFRIYCSEPDNAFTFIDEISAYDYNSDGTIDRNTVNKPEQHLTVNDFYDYNLNLGESTVKVSKDDADYNETQNLARLEGVDFQIQHFDPFPNSHSNTPKDLIGRLTDGVYHGELGSTYFCNYRGGGRHIVCDLGHIMAVDGTTFSFFDRYSWGGSTPPVFYVSLSENGTDWTTVYSYYKENYGKEELVADTHEIEFASSYKARYVRLTFQTVPDNEISSSVYLGEFEVIGKKNPEGASAAVEDDSPYGKYVSTEKYGIENILFAAITDAYGVHCTEKHVMSEESAYIYLSTFDSNGNANGVFMDSVAFSARGPLYNHEDRKECMEWFYDELFYEGLNLDAFEAAKERLNRELGTNDKVKIWISVNAPAEGEIFDGKKVTTTQQYVEWIKWQVDESIKRYNEKNYENLELVGFYWTFETVRMTEDIVVMQEFNEYVHDLGLLTFWCPYYKANGIWLCQDVGFDITCLQPNYMFYDTEPTRTDTTAELAKLYGMCVEIEIEGGIISDEVLELYRAYLKSGYEKGYMNSIKVYYQGGSPGAYVQGFKNDGKNDKAMYNETILYAKKELNSEHYVDISYGLEQFADKEITVKHGKSAEINIGNLKNYDYKFVTTPAYGSIRLDENGTLIYKAMKGYCGDDIVRIAIFDGKFDSKIISIPITVSKQ